MTGQINQALSLWGPDSFRASTAHQFSFDGRDDYAKAGSFNLPAKEMTIDAWIYPTGYAKPKEGRIISKADGINEQDHYFMLSTFEKGGKVILRGRLRVSGKTHTVFALRSKIILKKWTHVAMSFDGETIRLYQDGRIVGAKNARGTISSSSRIPVWIGANPRKSTDRPFKGKIDEVSIYSTAISKEGIKRIAQN